MRSSLCCDLSCASSPSIGLQESAGRELSLYVLILPLLMVLLRGGILLLDSIITRPNDPDVAAPLRERPSAPALQVVPPASSEEVARR